LKDYRAIEESACCLLLKVNQVGSISPESAAVTMAKRAGWGVMTSHRSGETEDTYIADLAVGLCFWKSRLVAVPRSSVWPSTTSFCALKKNWIGELCSPANFLTLQRHG
jgi:hypothetical protein